MPHAFLSGSLLDVDALELGHPSVVIGGGVSGLVAALRLAQRGLNPLVLEASARVGGFVAPLKFTGNDGLKYVFDAGAESFATRTSAVADLAAELGLTVVAPAPVGAFCVPAVGEPFPLPAAGMLGVPTDFDEPSLTVALSQAGVARAREDLVLPASFGSRENLAAFVADRMGQEVVDRLVAPIASGVHSTDPSLLDVTALHPDFWAFYEQAGSLSGAVREIRATAPAGSAVRGIEGGVNRLVSALVQRIEELGGTILTRASASFLAREQDRWTVGFTVFADADSVEEIVVSVRADRLVIATGAPAALGLLAGIDAATSDEVLAAPAGSNIALVTLLVDCQQLREHPSRGSGALVAAGGDIAAKGATHINAKWAWADQVLNPPAFDSGSNVIRLSYGRHGVSEVWETTALVQQAKLDFQSIFMTPFGNEAPWTVLDAVVTHWPDALPPATPALRDVARQVAQRVADLPGLAVTGAWMSGTGLAATVPHAQQCVALFE